jgi:Tfp pilus assembly protein PilF
MVAFLSPSERLRKFKVAVIPDPFLQRKESLVGYFLRKVADEAGFSGNLRLVQKVRKGETGKKQNLAKRKWSKVDVAGMQAKLNGLGFDAGPVDGIPGRKTRSALKSFQEINDLPVTGNPDEITLQRLFAAKALKSPPAPPDAVVGRNDHVTPSKRGGARAGVEHLREKQITRNANRTAIRELKEAVKRDSQNRAAWVHLGNLYFDTDQVTEAIVAYTNALEIRPDDPNVICDRAIMYRRMGDLNRAVAEFRRAIGIAPNHLNSLFNLGVVLRYDVNDVSGAIQAWNTFLSLNPPPDIAERVRREVETLEAQLRR